MPEKQTLVDMIVEKGKAGYAALYLQSWEDHRSLREIKQASEELKRKMFFWTPGLGLMEDTRRGQLLPNTEFPTELMNYIRDTTKIPEDSVVVLRLFHHCLAAPDVQGKLLHLIPEYKLSRRMLIVLSPVVKLPLEIEKEFDLIEAPLPEKAQFEPILDGILESNKIKDVPSQERRQLLFDAAKGLTTQEAENAFTLSIIRPRRQGKRKVEDLWLPEVVIDQKASSLRKDALLEYIDKTRIMRDLPEGGLDGIGGLDNLKEWVTPLQRAFTPEALTFGLQPPKGLLLVGPPGCGKSLFSKATALALHMPLLKLDMGKIFASLVGSSEANVRRAIQIAEAMSPCVLWLDEIEKGVSGASAGALDSGVSARVLGTLLNWMQEKESPVFVVATANDVSMLPPELLRKGRFDEMFSIDLPTRKERKEILNIHIKRRKREHLILPEGSVQSSVGQLIDLDYFSGETTQDFTGAEIDGAIEQAMRVAFHNGRDLNAMDLQEAFDSTQPISKTMHERLTMIRNWCKARTRPANKSEVPTTVRAGATGRAIDA
jgi:SpoVK/Ycf46/Vps4 family AAA+-type ATPase